MYSSANWAVRGPRGQRVNSGRRPRRCTRRWGSGADRSATVCPARSWTRSADRLAESRISILEERIELDLAIGDHADLIAELRDLVAEHPLRERLHGLLMLALYRAGRQADALTAFRDARRHLREELGVEPGAPLQRLHQQILAADPKLAATAAAEVTPSASALTGPQRPLPAQLPHRHSGLHRPRGRTQPAERAGGRTQRRHRDRCCHHGDRGTAGVGKSALAVHWAHRVSDRFPDGQLYVNLRGFDPTGSAMKPAEAIRGFLDAFGVPPEQIPASLEAQAALYRSLLAGRRVLVLLDNAADDEQVRPLLPGSPGCMVIVTSRNQLIGLLSPTAPSRWSSTCWRPRGAAAAVPPARRDRVAAEPHGRRRDHRRCAPGCPWPWLVAARAATHPGLPLSALAAELREAAAFAGRVRRRGPGHRRPGRILLVLPAARAFRGRGCSGCSGCTPDRTSQSPPRPAWPGVPPGAGPARAGRTGPGPPASTERYRAGSHFTTCFARTPAKSPMPTTPTNNGSAALHRVLDHYLHTAYRADQLLTGTRTRRYPGRRAPELTPDTPADQKQALAWFASEHAVLLAALRQAVPGFDTHAWQLAWTWRPISIPGALARLRETARRIALDAASDFGQAQAQAVVTASRWAAPSSG